MMSRNLFHHAKRLSSLQQSRGAKVLTMDTLNPNVVRMEYAVRGPIVQKANQIQEQINEGVKMPFNEVVRANLGDCHATGQSPITFIREVVALAAFPRLFDDPSFPSDAKDRARRVLNNCGGHSLGAYTDSAGVPIIRKDIAEYIARRDGHPSDWKNIFMSTGASEAIKAILSLINKPEEVGEGRKTGVMVPIPQYPLYSATITEYGMDQVGYYLKEEDHWSLCLSELKRSIGVARKNCLPKAIVVINPGNPTGQVLSRQNIEEIIKFAHEENLLILADEVYQHNVYADGCEFHSFKKVLAEMGPAYADQQLASFMSTSKGYMGECGYRGGYCEMVGFDSDVMRMLAKMTSARLCSNTSGQLVMECVVNPPQPGEPSYSQFEEEKNAILASLKKKANMVIETFDSIEGISCKEIQGAMYCFPRIDLPQKLLDHAKMKGMAPDAFYCFALLESTGLCVVPGSGFGQRDGSYHFRCTILPQEKQFEEIMQRFKVFHEDFIAKWH